MQLREIIMKSGKYLAGLATVLTIESWVRDNIIRVKEARQTTELEKDLIEKVKLIVDLRDNKIIDSVREGQAIKIIDQTEANFGVLTKLRATEDREKLNNPALTETEQTDLTNSIAENENNIDEVIRKSSDGLSEVISIFKGTGEGSKLKGSAQDYFIGQDYLTYFQSTVDSLSQYQKFALIHILSSVSIMFCLFTLIGVYTGNQLIEYFQLTERFPRLARYIKLRHKFTRYYFI